MVPHIYLESDSERDRILEAVVVLQGLCSVLLKNISVGNLYAQVLLLYFWFSRPAADLYPLQTL